MLPIEKQPCPPELNWDIGLLYLMFKIHFSFSTIFFERIGRLEGV